MNNLMPEISRDTSRRLFCLSLAGAVLVHAQEPETTFSTDVKVISVIATVRDKQGRIVSTLSKEDFSLTEDGRSQLIRYFSRETDLPLTLGLLVDTSLSQRRVLGEERTASYRFLDKVLRPEKDRTFVMHFDREAELLQDLTSSRTELQHALDLLELPELPANARGGGQGGGGNGGGGYPGGGGGQGGSSQGGGGIGFPGGGIGFPGGGGRRGGRGMGGQRPQQGGGGRRGGSGPGTTMYDAIYLASNEITKKEKGRKALILLTDGVDNGSKISLSDAVEAAQRADTLVYSILFSDAQLNLQPFGGQGRDGKKVLQRLSGETGGSFFEVSKKLSIDGIYTRLQEELRNQYSLGYSSDNPAGGAAYRTTKVAVGKPGLVVQSREGYYPGR
jgi:VWFA-related protein